MRKKLYLVTLQGFFGSPVKSSYVVAPDPEIAYQTVREWLVEEKYGFQKDMEMKSVELVADSKKYPDTPSQLFEVDEKDYLGQEAF